jgi:hypothetical protein
MGSFEVSEEDMVVCWMDSDGWIEELLDDEDLYVCFCYCTVLNWLRRLISIPYQNFVKKKNFPHRHILGYIARHHAPPSIIGIPTKIPLLPANPPTRLRVTGRGHAGRGLVRVREKQPGL